VSTPPPTSLPPLALGCYPLGGGYGGLSVEDARRTVDAALDVGWNLLDTAEAYLDSEERVGAILEGRRDGVFLATKAFPSEAFSARNLKAALEMSLRRLRTDRIDLYQLHGPEDWVTATRHSELSEIAGVLGELKASGKVLNVGVCNMSLDDIRAIAAGVDLFSTQNLLSLFDREGYDDLHLSVAAEILPWAQASGVHFLAFSPLARGLLGDRLDENRRFGEDDERFFLPRFQPDVYPEYIAVARRLKAWAADHGRPLSHLAIAWTIATPGVSSTLIGAKTAEQVQELAGAADWQLMPSEVAEVEAIADSLSERGRQAQSIVWDHFQEAALAGLRARREPARTEQTTTDEEPTRA
jgi:aryl-alcohol dehydrogenase-like predicted oxidoreductase